MGFRMNSLKNTAQPALSVVKSMSYADMSDAELVVLCQQKDQGAFDVLVRRHQRTVYGMLMKLAPDWTDTADLSQEAFIRIWKGIGKLQNPKSF